MSMFSRFFRWFATFEKVAPKTPRQIRKRLGIDTLEDRTVPAAILAQYVEDLVPSKVVLAGTSNVPVVQVTSTAQTGFRADYLTVTRIGAPYTGRLDLKVDVDGDKKPDLFAGSVTFAGGSVAKFAIPDHIADMGTNKNPLMFQVTTDIPLIQKGIIGFDLGQIGYETVWETPMPQVYVQGIKVNGGTHFAVSPAVAPSASVSVLGASYTYAPGQTDVELAQAIIVSSTGEMLDGKSVYVVVEGKGANGMALPQTMTQTVSGVEVRNMVTGATYAATPVYTGMSRSNTLGVYRISNMPVISGHNLQIRADLGNALRTGDVLTASIITTPVGGGAVNVGGIASTSSWNLDLKSFANGLQVTNVNPRGVLKGNPQKIAAPTIIVSGQSFGTEDVVVANQKNVPLLREKVGGSAFDTLFVGQSFIANGGTNAQNYSLWVDTDNNGVVDTVLQKGVSSSGGKIRFDNLTGGGFAILKGGFATFEVHADIASSFSGTTLTVTSDTSAGAVSVEQLANGQSLVGINVNGTGTGQIYLYPHAGPVLNLKTSGTVTVSRSTTPDAPDYLLAGTEGKRGLRVPFDVTDEDVYLTKVHILVDNIGARSLDRINIYQVTSNGLVLRAMGTIAGLGSEIVPFQGGRVFAVNIPYGNVLLSKETRSEFVFLPVAKSDVDGAIPGDLVTLQIVSLPGYQPVSGIGKQSSNFVSVSVAPGIASPAYYISGSKVHAVLDPDAVSNGSAIGSGPQSFDVQVSTLGNVNAKYGLNKAALSTFSFVIDTVNNNVDIDLTQFVLLNKANTSVWVTPSSIVGISSTAYRVTFTGLAASAVNTEIDSNSSQTFRFGYYVSNPKVLSYMPSTLIISLDTNGIEWYDRDSGANTLFAGFFLSDPVLKYIRKS